MLLVLSFFLFSLISVEGQNLQQDTISDIEGNVYKTVKIGRYEWMAENLRTTTYNEGTKIPNITEYSAWANLSNGAYCWYNNDESNAEEFGALYNWYAVNTGKLCPDGWRIPTDEDWKYLEGYVDTHFEVGDTVWDNLGSQGYDAGRRLKAKEKWKLGGNGTDDFGFSALPGGERSGRDGNFFILGGNGFWWSNTEDGQANAIFRCIIYALPDISRNSHDKKFGFSVRCIRDN